MFQRVSMHGNRASSYARTAPLSTQGRTKETQLSENFITQECSDLLYRWLLRFFLSPFASFRRPFTVLFPRKHSTNPFDDEQSLCFRDRRLSTARGEPTAVTICVLR